MSNNNSFGGKLKKVLASMCSFVVGASGVSQAGKHLDDPKNVDYKTVFGVGDDDIRFIGADGSLQDLFNVRVGLIGDEDSDLRLEMNVYQNGSMTLTVCGKDGVGPASILSLSHGVFLDLVKLYREKNSINLAQKLAEAKDDVDAKTNLLKRFLAWVFNCGNWDGLKKHFTYSAKDVKEGSGWRKFDAVVDKNNKKKTVRKEFYTPVAAVFHAEIAEHVGYPKVKKMLDDEVKKFTDFDAQVRAGLLGLAKAVANKIPTASDSGTAQKAFINSVSGKDTGTWDGVDLKDKGVDEIFKTITDKVSALVVTGVDNGVTDSLTVLGYTGSDIKARVVALKKDLLVKLGLGADSNDPRNVEQLLQALADQHKQALENQKGFGKGALVGSGAIGMGIGIGGTLAVQQSGLGDYILSAISGKKRNTRTRGPVQISKDRKKAKPSPKPSPKKGDGKRRILR